VAELVPRLRGFVEERLPEYMVPSAFVVLDALPLTPNGKVDRDALPALGRERPDLMGEFVAPRSEMEQSLVDIWAEVLGIERIGVHDEFFLLGGHSLLATQVVSRIRDVFEVELPLRALFESPTVAELANLVAEMQLGSALGSSELDELLSEVENLLDEELQRLLPGKDQTSHSPT
jgi:acyl carrier protein